MRHFLISFRLLGALIVLTGNLAASQKPNFVLIYTDDLDFDEVGAYGAEHQPCGLAAARAGAKNPPFAYPSPGMLTPNLDSIARDGAHFERFYISSPVCTPSRYGILTGRSLLPLLLGAGQLPNRHLRMNPLQPRPIPETCAGW